MPSTSSLNKRKRRVYLVAMLVMLLAVGLGFLLYSLSQLGVEDLIGLEQERVWVSIQSPSSGQAGRVGQSVSVIVSAWGGNPINRLVFWVDDAVVRAVEQSGTEAFLESSWFWTPRQKGSYSLTVWAYDAEGNVGISNVVEIHVDNAISVSQEEYTPQPGEDLVEAAARLNMPPEVLLASNPEIQDPANPLPEDEPLSYPVVQVNPVLVNGGFLPNKPAPAPSQPSQGDQLSIWKKVALAIKKLGPKDVPAEPRLKAVVMGCDVVLTITPGSGKMEEVFLIYRQSSVGDFERIAVLLADPQGNALTYRDENVWGDLIYYAEAANAAYTTPGSQIKAEVTDALACFNESWAELSWETFQLTMDDPLDMLYCYISRDGGAWSRIPPSLAEDGFWKPDSQGVFNLKESMPLIVEKGGVPVELDIKCLGWQGGGLVENYLGKITVDPDQVGEPMKLSGAGWSLEAVAAWEPKGMGGGTGGGSDGGDGGGTDYLSPGSIHPPENVRRTLDPATCAAYMYPEHPAQALQACIEAIEQGKLVLVWDWIYYSCWPDADGVACGNIVEADFFRSLRTDLDGSNEISSGQIIPSARAVILSGYITEPSLYYIIACAEVTDYGYNTCSEPSNSVKVTDITADPHQTILLKADELETWYEEQNQYYKRNCSTCTANWPGGCGADYPNAGEAWAGIYNGRCGQNTWKASAHFDLSPLSGKVIKEARLSYWLLQSHYSFPGVAINWRPSCAAEVGYIDVEDGWKYYKVKDLNRFSAAGSGPEFSVDVTEVIVQSLTDNPYLSAVFELKPGPPYGSGGDGAIYWAESGDLKCYSRYGHWRLEVITYQADY